MNHSKEKFSSMDIRDAIGAFADDGTIAQEYVAIIKAAVQGVVETSDRGSQIFVVGVYAANQPNVDTEELIWPRDPTVDYKDDVPLKAISNPELWKQAEAYWMEQDPLAWTAFVWRVAVPLVEGLGIIGAWDKIRYREQLDKLKGKIQ